MITKKWFMIAAFVLLAGTLQTSGFAASRGGRGMRSGPAARGEFHEGFRGGDRDFGRAYGPRVYINPGWDWGWNWGWDYPWGWGPYYYPAPEIRRLPPVNYGTLEFNVKPEQTEIYVDNKFIGTVKSLDHHRAYMKQGDHVITLKAPDGRKTERNIYVAAGKKIKIKETL